jgi:hypothetical protein
MSVLVEQQDETIDTIQTAAAGVEKDTETGYVFWFFDSYHLTSICILGLDTPTKPSSRQLPLVRSDGFASSLY